MPRLRLASCVSLAVLTVLAFAGPATARKSPGKAVPFKGSLDGLATVTPIAPPVFAVEIDAGGRATRLGRYTVSIPHVVDRSTRLAEGAYEFTAANGDTLSAQFTGQSFVTDVPGVLYIVEVATITGGTGRFAGATGGFTVERYFDTITGETTGSFEGTVSSPGRGKH